MKTLLVAGIILLAGVSVDTSAFTTAHKVNESI